MRNEVSGTVVGSVTQVGTMNVHHHGHRARRGVLDGSGDGTQQCPYPGLASFGAQFTQWFYGRDQVVATVCQRLDGRLRGGGPLMVIGPSGAGKSSLLAAGVLPAIGRGALPVEGSASWRRLLMSPTDTPALALARALGSEDAVDEWRADPDRCVADVWRHADPDGHPGLVLIVDQFEEVFTLCADETERQWFIAVLDRISRSPANDTIVILGLRADWYSACTAYDHLRDALRADPILLDPMTDAEINEAIRTPAGDVGLEVEDGLVELLLADLGAFDDTGRDGAGATARSWAGKLPLLAHALRATWQQRDGNVLTVDGYRLTGRIQAAIATTAEQLFASLTPASRDVARTLFLRLVFVGRDADDVRRHVRHADLVRDLPDPELAATVVDKFTRGRLLTTEQDTVSIAHEALIRAWPRLRGWIDQDRTGNLVRQDLEATAAAWDTARREPALLYRGNRLLLADSWASRHPDQMTATVAAFLASAHRQERRGRRLRRVAVASITVLALVASVVAAYALHQGNLLQAAAEKAVSDQLAAEAQQVLATDPALAAQLTLLAYRRDPSQDNLARLLATQNIPIPTTLATPIQNVSAIAYRPTGHVLATGDRSGTMRLWDITDPIRPHAMGQPLTSQATSIRALAFSPDGRHLAAGGANGAISLWDTTDPARATSVDLSLALGNATTNAVAFSPDGRTIVAGGVDSTDDAGVVQAWNPAGATEARFTFDGWVDALAFDPTGRTLVVGNQDDVGLYATDDLAQPVATLRTPGNSAAFSPDGRILATGGISGALTLWSMADPRTPVAYSYDSTLGKNSLFDPAPSVAFSPDSHILAGAHSDGSISLWNVAEPALPAPIVTLTGSGGGSTVTFGPDGQTLASMNNDGSVVLWHLPSPLLVAFGPTAVSPRRSLLAVPDDNSTIRLWDMANAHAPAALGTITTGSPTAANAMGFSRDGRILAVGDDDSVVLADVSNPRRPVPLGAPLTGFTGIDSMVFSPDGHSLAVATTNSGIILWNTTDPRSPTQYDPPLEGGGTASLAFSPDGHTLVAVTEQTVQSWSVADPRAASESQRTLTEMGQSIMGATLSSDGHTLAVGNADAATQLWDVTNPTAPVRQGGPLAGPNDSAATMAFSPDGRELAAGGADGAVWLWTLADQPSGPLAVRSATSPDDEVTTVAFVESGVLVTSSSGVTLTWDLHTDYAIQRICSITASVLTPKQWDRYVPHQLSYQPPC